MIKHSTHRRSSQLYRLGGYQLTKSACESEMAAVGVRGKLIKFEESVGVLVGDA